MGNKSNKKKKKCRRDLRLIHIQNLPARGSLSFRNDQNHNNDVLHHSDYKLDNAPNNTIPHEVEEPTTEDPNFPEPNSTAQETARVSTCLQNPSEPSNVQLRMGFVTPVHIPDMELQNTSDVATLPQEEPSVSNEDYTDVMLVEQSCEIQSNAVSGRRIVDIGYFFEQLKQLDHESLFQCSFRDLNLLKETRKGLVSTFLFECALCKKHIKIHTDKKSKLNPARELVEVNMAAVSGIIASGIGYTQFGEVMSAVDVPVFSEKYYGKIQDNIFNEWESTADDIMAKAAERERTAAIEEGRLVNGIPVIDVFADGAWSKRSYGNNYKALSGVAAIVGRRFGEVLFIGVKNKYCLICAKAQKLKTEPKTHVCYKNYEGPSSGMEAAIICEGFKESINMYGLIYGSIVADGDSSTYSKILAANPYPGHVVAKIECRNHLFRNMCNKLRAIGKDTKYPKATRRHITDEKIMSMRKVVTSSIKHNKTIPTKDIAINSIYEDIQNSSNHAFGDHTRCKDYYCHKEKAAASSTVAELERSSFWFRIKVILRSVASKSRSLLEDVDTNAVERFNGVVAKFVGGKRINFASRRSYQSRCAAAVVSFNTNRPLYILHKNLLGKSPRGCIKKFDQRKESKRKRANAVKRKKNRGKQFEKQNEYGQKVAAPDMGDAEFSKAVEEFFKNLDSLVGDREGIQQRTTKQRECEEWLEIRRLLITASNFGNIIKRRKNFPALVKNILYKSNISSVASVAHGLNNEQYALQQLSCQENCVIEECGLYIDREFPYIGATPDGKVGDDMIVEVKCPVAAFKNGMDNAIKHNKVQILKYNKKDGNISINKNSNWYYQAQGQLHVANKQRCMFGIWAGEKEKLEVLYIQKDDEFWEKNMKEKLLTFYRQHILPELVDPRQARGMPLRGSEKQ